MTDFTPLQSLFGGALIGLSAVLLMAFHGRIAGTTGLLAGVLPPLASDWPWRAAFLLGAAIAPMLWLRAGARGPIITEIGDKGWDLTDMYGVLDDLDTAARFVTEVKKAPGVAMVYIVTDDDLAFQMVCRELPKGVRPVQLYESYLRNFEINSGRFA